MIEKGRCRKVINKDIHRVRGMFRWAAAEELYPVARLEALEGSSALEKGRSNAKERPPVAEVPDQIVMATIPQLSPEVARMVKIPNADRCPTRRGLFHPAPGHRPHRPRFWHYRPESHKTQHMGRERLILIGPRAQEILRPGLIATGHLLLLPR